MSNTINNVQQDQLQQIDNTQNQILQSSRNIKQLAIQSEDAATATMQNLADQKDKLDQTEENMGRINKKIDEAEQGLDELDKCCGLCILPWKRFRPKKSDGGKVNEGVEHSEEQPTTKQPISGNQNIHAADINLKKIVKDDVREDEINENVQYASKAVANLHMMALDMGSELTTQNAQLDRINKMAVQNDSRLQDVTAQATRRLK